MARKIMFICPFWNQIDHVGTIRAERLVHWMKKLGFKVFIVAAGHSDSSQVTDFGELIVIKDPLRIYPDVINIPDKAADSLSHRKPNKFRRWFAYFFLVPDLHILWSKSVYRSKKINTIAKECDLFLASSPPESSFDAASKLSDRFGGKFIMDMRDGWLDEPMKPLLKSLWIQRFREKRIEKNTLNKAASVWVTSGNWKSLLQGRYPGHSSKIHVLPNCYPNIDSIKSGLTTISKIKKPNHNIRLLHAGKISSSRPERNVELLLDILLQHIDSKGISINITFLGSLDNLETSLIHKWDQMFQKHNSKLTIKHSVSRIEALNIMHNSDGLLMISNSYASIPAKYYDYSVSGKPVLNYTTINSASQNATIDQPQFYNLIEQESVDRHALETTTNTLDAFFNHCMSDHSIDYKLNPFFTEDHVYEQFKSILNELNHE